MTSPELKLYIEGPDPETAAQIARDLAGLFETEFDHRPDPEPATPMREPGTKQADPVAVAALILAIPPSLLAAVDIVDRAKKTDKIQKLIEWVRHQKKTHRHIRFKLATPKGTVIQFDMSSSSEIQEIAAEARIMEDASE